MKDFLFLIFNEMGMKYYRQGTTVDDIEPDEFFTYWNIQDSDEYVNNVPAILKNTYQVYFYCHERQLLKNPNYLEDTMNEFVQKARGYGLTVAYVQDINTGLKKYLGRMCRVEYTKHE